MATGFWAKKDNEAMIRLLIQFGLDPKLASHGSCAESCLVQAAGYNSPNTVQALLEHGAGLSKGNILQALVVCHDGFTSNLLLAEIDTFDPTVDDYRIILRTAIQSGHLSLVGKLLSRGLDVNGTGSPESAPLMIAIESKHEAVVRFLLGKGANINTTYSTGWWGSALSAASASKHLDQGTSIVQLLLEKGAHINAQCGRWGNALQAAAYSQNKAVIEILIENGAECYPNSYGYKKLKECILLRHAKVEDLLKDAKVNWLSEGPELNPLGVVDIVCPPVVHPDEYVPYDPTDC